MVDSGDSVFTRIRSTTHDRLSRPDVQSNGLASTDYNYDPATFALDKETITYNIPDQAEFTRVIDHKQDTLQRNEDYTLQTPGTTPTIEQNVTYRYSATNGRLGAVSGGAFQAPSQTFTYGYTANSNLIGSIHGPAHTVSNTYEDHRNVLLTKANTRASDNSTISSIGYTVNPIGQRTNATRSGAATNSTAWTYDALGQLVTADDSTNTFDRAYQYDGIGNREKSADGLTLPSSNNYTVNALNQYTAVNAFTPTHDDDGNQIDAQFKPTDSSSLITGTYHWDAENRLTEVKNTSTTTLVKHYYDAQSRRIASTAGGLTTIYVYQGWNVIAEYTGSSPTLIKTNLWRMDLSGSLQGAGGVGGLLSITDHGSLITTHFPLYDGNGNITEYINSSEAVVAHYEYDPFGNTTVATGIKADDFAYRFSTKPIDKATGLYYYGYRYYDPLTSRWPSRDPIEKRGGVNLYRFINNRALDTVDYLGLRTCTVTVFWGHAPEAKKRLYEHNLIETGCNFAGALGCGLDGTNKSIAKTGGQVIDSTYKAIPNFPNCVNGAIGTRKYDLSPAHRHHPTNENGGFKPPGTTNQSKDLISRTATGFTLLAADAWQKAIDKAKSLCHEKYQCKCKCDEVIVKFVCVSEDRTSENLNTRYDQAKDSPYTPKNYDFNGVIKPELDPDSNALSTGYTTEGKGVRKLPLCGETLHLKCKTGKYYTE